ncbi:TrmB family transcriptional regulator [Nanoarchaeota archaeon]
MNTKILEDIGLTQGEIKVYLALLEQGPSSAGEILKQAKIQNSVFHFNINRLIEKGLVAYRKKNKFRIYSAADPNQFLTYMKDKETQIKTFLPQLKAKQAFAKEKEEAEIFEGKKGIMTALNILIEDTKPGDEFLFYPDEYQLRDEEIEKFFIRYNTKRKDKKLKVKAIATKEFKQNLDKLKNVKTKYTNLPLPSNQGICNNKLIIMTWDKNPRAILITSRSVVSRQKRFFNALWESL